MWANARAHGRHDRGQPCESKVAKGGVGAQYSERQGNSLSYTIRTSLRRGTASEQRRVRGAMRRAAFGIVVALCVSACGGGGGTSQAQVRACWTEQMLAFSQQYAKEIGSGLAPSAGLTKSSEQIVIDDAQLYEAGKLTPDLTTPEITAHLKATQAKCGKLKVSLR